ncbi:zinc ribbon domain-containing protein [Shewanella aestuarii]|uniref:PDZ domain-containing protein n=1 Tax=Shewanella aestuarii TaxID=1028752 RepID=A0A6G9QQ99_9GAMM|nr:zinc ribbon domain-containing protein [Shewanella aestuarii]QIR16642.1 hypothetical protein HBH39_19400 [Shewanella aestuarii]
MSEVARVKIIEIDPHSYGESVGFKKGDVILKFNDEVLTDASQLRTLVAYTVENESKYLVLRGSEKLTIVAKTQSLGVTLANISQERIVVKRYVGKQEVAINAFKDDAERMASDGYVPTNQTWAEGSYGCGGFLIALLLCFIFVGILVFIYMLIVKPDGTLTVTYEKQSEKSIQAPDDPVETGKVCPDCAEVVKEAAKICRYCRHEFVQ